MAGHDQLVPSVVGFMAVAAVGSYPAESFLKEFFLDDRVLRQHKHLRESIDEEVVYIRTLPGYVWRRLSALVEGHFTASELLDKASQCALISSAYIHKETLALVEQEPFSLSQGDIEENMHELATRVGPISDPMARQAHELLVNDLVSPARLARAFLLLREAPFTTNMVEQAHGLGACLMKHNECYGERLLRARGLISQMKPLFSPDSDDRRELKLKKELADIEGQLHRGLRRGSGFTAFFGEFVKAGQGRRRSRTSAGARAVMSEAAEACTQIDGGARVDWESLADQQARRREVALRERRDELHVDIRLCEHRRSIDLAENGLVNQVKSCMYTDQRQQQILDRFNKLHNEGIFGSRLEQRALSAPFAPSQEEQEMIAHAAQPFVTPLPELPWLIPHICRHRDRCQGAALAQHSADAQIVHFFVLALKKPFEAHFLWLRRRPRVLRLGQATACSRIAKPFWRTEYDYMPLEHIPADKLPLGNDDEASCSTRPQPTRTPPACPSRTSFATTRLARSSPGSSGSDTGRSRPPPTPPPPSSARFLG